mmetsp:Transcript_159963/g.489328  ORF Transcript_159963/g.489328 Transcript_159963/m.489328 type:complete len:540 (+) Transcript_159963:105-1724(+)
MKGASGDLAEPVVPQSLSTSWHQVGSGSDALRVRARSTSSARSLRSTASTGSRLRVHVGAQALLDAGVLPEEGSGELSVFAIAVNLTMLILGTTILGIASHMKHGGWLVTPALLCLSGLIVMEMIRLVGATVDRLNQNGIRVRTYQDLATGALGARGARLANLTSTLDLVFYTFISLVLESQILQAVLPIAWPWFGCTQCGEKWWAVLLSSTTIVFSFVELGPLARIATMIGPAVTLLMVLSIVMGAMANVGELTDFPEVCREGNGPENAYWELWPGPSESLLFVVPRIMSYSFFCFAIVCTVPTLQSEMREPSKLGVAGVAAIITASVMLLLIMCLSYWGTGSLGPENIISGMRRGKPLGWWAVSGPWEVGSMSVIGQLISVIVASNLVLIDATYVPCAVLALEQSAPQLWEAGSRGSRTAFVVGRLCLVFLRLFVAVGVTSFIALSSLSSSLFCLCNNVLLPIAAFYSTGGAQSTGLARKLAHGLSFLLGCFILVFGTAMALSQLLAPAQGGDFEPGIFPRSGTTQACQATYHEATR